MIEKEKRKEKEKNLQYANKESRNNQCDDIE